MFRLNRRRPGYQLGLAACAAAAFAGPASSDVVFQTETPFGGIFGINGFDVFPGQSVAARFIPSADHRLDHVRIWFMSNDFDGVVPQTVTVTLRTDVNPGGEFDSVPSEVILESWTKTLSVVGWNPELEDFTSVVRPALNAGQKYWVVAQSDLPALSNPVWVWASVGNEFTATTDGPGTPWEGGWGAAVAFVIEGTRTGAACLGDFDNSGGQPTVQDIFEFLTAYFSNDARADINNSGGNPTSQDIFDFLNAYFVGCP